MNNVRPWLLEIKLRSCILQSNLHIVCNGLWIVFINLFSLQALKFVEIDCDCNLGNNNAFKNFDVKILLGSSIITYKNNSHFCCLGMIILCIC